jgi:hypothetical protein
LGCPLFLLKRAAKTSCKAEVHKIFRKLIVIFGVELSGIWYNTNRNNGII